MANISKVELNGTTYNINTSGSIPESEKGTANGVASLDSSGKVPSSQLPSYVDDVLEYSAKSSFPATGETGKIYVDTTTNKTYRWSGSAYVEISKSLALGETSSTAYRGDRGKAAYDHSQITNGNPHGTTGANTNLTGYSKGSSKDAVAATDTVNAAIAKHENRINANQSNILYATNKVGKNELKLTGNVSNPNTLRVYWNYEEGTVRITGTVATTSTVFISLGSWTAKKTGEYVLASEGANSTNIYVYDDGSWNTNGSPIATWTAGTTRNLYVRIASGVVVGDVTVKPMVCLKTLYDEDSSVDAYALPNYDLTRLEAEDRAGLVDVVDSGAKNILDFANLRFQTQAGTTHTKTDTDITVTSSSAWAACTYKMALSAGNYVFSAKISNLSIGSGGAAKICLDTQADGHGTRAATLAVEKNGTVSKPFTWGGGTLYIMYYPNYTATAVTTTFKASENMICTKAAFGVSNKFVPYRPSWDLVYSSLQCDVKYAKVPVSTNYSLIGSIKTKGNRVCRITVTQEYAAVAPTGLILSKSNQSSDFNTLTNMIAPPVETTTDNLTLTISALCYYTYDRVVYIWAKAKTASTNGNNFMALCEHFGDIDGVKNSMT